MEKAARDFEKARAEWNLENQSQMSDAVIDVVDLTQSVAQDLTGVSAVGSKLAAKVAGEAGVKAVAARVVAAGVKGFGEESVKSTAKELYRQHWRREAAEMPETLPTIGSRVAKQAVGFPASGGAKGVEVQALEEAAAALEREAASRVLGPADPAQVGDRLIKRQVGTPNPVSRAADAGSTIAQAAAKTLSYGETIASGVRDYVGREALKSKISDRKWAAWDRYWQERAKWRQARMDHQQLVRKITSTVRER
jgi:hypothetical protein